MLAARVDSGRAEAAKTVEKSKNLPAPISGWASNASIALDNPGYAEVLENFIPTQTGVRARGGSPLYATVSRTAVHRFIEYRGTTSSKLFVASNNGIFDITSPASPISIPAFAVSAFNTSEIAHVSVSNAGGDFLLVFNGTDLHRVYDGSTWATNTPAITGVSSALITQAAVHNNRVWMVQKNSKRAWYLPVSAIGGAALDFSLEGEFTKGGSLLFISTWSYDSGSGSSDRIAFFSTEGECVVFGGLFPGDSSWQKFGRYEMPKPLGKYAFDKVGGDLLIETVTGIVSMTEIVTKDPAALSLTSITAAIEPDWKAQVSLNQTRPWSFQKWPEKNIGFVAIPCQTQTRTLPAATWGTAVWGVDFWGTTGTVIEEPAREPVCFVVNLLTGKWAKILGWDVRCMTVFNGRFYFGTSSGKIFEGDTGGKDNGRSYECRIAYWPSKFDDIGHKSFLQVEGVFVNATPINPKFSISVDNKLDWPAPPGSGAESSSVVLWDSGVKWDSGAKWDSKGTKIVTTRRWNSLGRSGRVGALKLQMTFNTNTTPVVEYTEATVTWSQGAVVT